MKRSELKEIITEVLVEEGYLSEEGLADTLRAGVQGLRNLKAGAKQGVKDLGGKIMRGAEAIDTGAAMAAQDVKAKAEAAKAKAIAAGQAVKSGVQSASQAVRSGAEAAKERVTSGAESAKGKASTIGNALKDAASISKTIAGNGDAYNQIANDIANVANKDARESRIRSGINSLNMLKKIGNLTPQQIRNFTTAMLLLSQLAPAKKQ
jgi:hypothetical protein